MARTFTRIGKQIAIAVKAGGPDAENNPHLRAIIATAKRENMPKDNIERAIKNAMGKDQKDYKEMNYEGYGPFGIAIYVETATDNTTRTVANVRSIFNKLGGSLGTSGSLDFIFTRKSMFTITPKEGVDMDELILELIDYGVEDEYDVDEEENEITFHAAAGFQIPEEKYWEVLDYINTINAVAHRYPRLYIYNRKDELYLLEAEYHLLIQNPMKANIFARILSDLIRILEDNTPDILRIILDIETEENE